MVCHFGRIAILFLPYACISSRGWHPVRAKARHCIVTDHEVVITEEGAHSSHGCFRMKPYAPVAQLDRASAF
jgi:hypothetical protein